MNLDIYLRVVVFITQHGIPFTQAKMALSHKARITQVFEKVVKNKLSHKLLKKLFFTVIQVAWFLWLSVSDTKNSEYIF